MGRQEQDIGRIDVELEYRMGRPEWKSILFHDGRDKVWLPKSQIVMRSGARPIKRLFKGDAATVNLPEWLAREKGLI